MNRSRVTVYGFSFSHHGQYSSFSRLLRYAQECRVVDVTFPLRTFPGPAWRGRLEYCWFRWNEWRLRPVFAARERQCIHYIYPENTLFRGGNWKGRHGLVLSCHQPGPNLRRMAHGNGYQGFMRGLSEADRVVLLAAHLADDYKEFCDRRQLAVIPHGVEVSFFTPPPDRPQQPLVLTVGNWLRDYDFWAEIVLRLADQIPDVEFAVVALPQVVQAARARVEPRLAGRVHFLHNLTDEQLRALYWRAAVLFLPLKDTVANNALLESMASGVPALVSDLPAAREYAGECGTFFECGATEDCLAKLAELLGDAAKRATLSSACRQRAVAHFSWEAVAARYARLYAEVLAD
jgi:glycosyltransferase involved in cell wall biosynthesis